MCWLLKFSRYVSVPIIVGWLSEECISRLECAISSKLLRKSFRELLNEYSKLLCDNLFKSNHEMSFVHACSLCSKWNLNPSTIHSKIILGNFDLSTIRKHKLTSTASTLVPLMNNVSFNVIGKDEEYLIKLMSLMKSTIVLDVPNTSTLDVLQTASMHCRFLTTVKLACDDNKSAILALCRQCTLIATLELGKVLDWDILTAVVVHCRNLQQLVASMPPKMVTTYTARAIYFCAFHSSRKSFVWNSDHPIYKYYHTFRLMLWNKGSQFVSLQLNPDNMKHLSDISISQTCPRLHTISFNSISSYASNVEYHNRIVATVRDCPSLKSIHLLKITNPTDETLLALAACCNTQLREFHLDGRTPFPFSLTGVQMLCSQCNRMATLALLNLILSDEMVVSIVSLVPHLTELSLLGCTDVTDCCLQLLAQHCQNLLKLNFECEVEVTAAGLDAVADYCLSLSYLNLSFCDCMDITACRALMNASALKTLEISEITVHRPELDSSNSAVVTSLLGAHITSLKLSTVYLTDPSLLWIIPQCPRLLSLDVSANHSITSPAVVAVVPLLKRLRTLLLGWCDRLDDTVADAICTHCKRLERLSIKGTAISNYAIERIERQCDTLLFFIHDGSN